jgi:CheY-like chemotaxis protein
LILPAEVVAADSPARTTTDAAGAIGTSSRSRFDKSSWSTSLRVLVVEDNPVNQRVAATMLASFGCQVTLVANGREAVEALVRPTFDLVLMDCFMPEMDGFEATRLIRQREWGTARHVPIIALTASASDDERLRCLEAGMDDYLAKPYRKAELAQVLDRHLPVSQN